MDPAQACEVKCAGCTCQPEPKRFAGRYRTIGKHVALNVFFLLFSKYLLLRRNFVVESPMELVNNLLYKMGLKWDKIEYEKQLEEKRKSFNYEYTRRAYLNLRYQKKLYNNEPAKDEKEFYESLNYHFKDGYFFRDEGWLRKFYFGSENVITYPDTQKINQFIFEDYNIRNFD